MSATNGTGHSVLTVEKLAEAKRLPVEFLRSLGVTDAPRGVNITYSDDAGNDLFVKTRHKLKREDSSDREPLFTTAKGQRVTSYGDWRIDQARREGSLLLVEGESDCWTLWLHGFQAIGIPGAENTKTLTAEHLVGIDTLYVHREPDAGGQKFLEGIKSRLTELNYRGRVLVLSCPDGVKDPSDLHILDPEKFNDRFGDALATAKPIDWRCPCGSGFTCGLCPKCSKQPNTEDSPFAFHWDPIPSNMFFAADYRPRWLVKNAVVDGQPLVMGGPPKMLKTTLAIDLAISLATAGSWLGTFGCPDRRRAVVVSGESGPWALQSVGRRVCEAKGIDPAGLGDYLHWHFRLPQLASLDQLETLRAGLERDRCEVVIIDPLYLSLLAGSDGPRAENLFDTGPLLLRVAQVCQSVGATPILLHHTTKPSAQKRGPLDLSDLAFSGCAEFARQWLLLSRREAFEPDSGEHKLWMVVGGSVGHSGLYALDINEGQLDEDFGGRRWDVQMQAASAARSEEKTKKAASKNQAQREQDMADEAIVMALIDRLDADGGATLTRLRDSSGISEPRTDKALARLRLGGLVKEAEASVKIGSGAKRKVPIYRRAE